MLKLLAVASLLICASAVPLARKVGKPASYNWDKMLTSITDVDIKPILQICKSFGLPSATLGYQLNPNASYIPYAAPTQWQSPQFWWMVGFGMSYKTPMRVASVSKPILEIVYENTPKLKQLYGSSFYALWKQYINPNIAQPLDPLVKSITIRQLLDHTSGFNNTKIGYDPAFQGKTVDVQLPTIIAAGKLASSPGQMYSYSNFGYMILGRIAEGVLGKTYNAATRAVFPAGAPIYAADNNNAVAANAVPSAGAAEPSIYYIQGANDGPFDVTVMTGNGRMVSNVATLSWIGTQYRIGGTNVGKSFKSLAPSPGFTWIMDGSMPGTMAVLVQYVTPKGRVASMSFITNTRVPSSNSFLNQMNNAMKNALVNKFAAY